MQPIQPRIAETWNKLSESWRFAIAAFVIARLIFAVWSWVIFTIQPVAVQNFELSGEPVLSVFRLQDSQGYLYLRVVNGNILTFQPVNAEELADRQTGSHWNISTGESSEGPYQNTVLSRGKTPASDIFPYLGNAPYPGIWLAMWQRFDANWYLSIAERGYGNVPGDAHFPPLYPVLIRLLKPLLESPFLAGLFISHLATLLALKLLYETYMQWGDRLIGRRAMILFLIYPTSFFLFSAYTEPLFLVTALLALRAMQSKAWPWAGFWIFCAVLFRLQGVALFVPMLFLMWRDVPFLRKLSHWAGLGIASVSGLLYLYLRSRQGTEHTLPFVETDLRARLVPPWQSIVYSIETLFTGNANFIDTLNLTVTVLFLALIIWGWKKIPLEYTIYTIFSLLILLTRVVETQPLMSMSRYSLTLFPCFYILSLAADNSYLRRVLIYGSILLALYLSGQFFIWGWVA